LIAASLFGLFAVVAIIPLAAAGKVFVEELYVKDRLGGGWHTEGAASLYRGALGGLLRRIKHGK
jgi:hypothetical protein